MDQPLADALVHGHSGDCLPAVGIGAQDEHAQDTTVFTSQQQEPEGAGAATEFEQRLKTGMVQTVAGGAGKLPRFARLQHIRKGVAEIVAVELIVLSKLGTVKGPATEVELQRPAPGETEGFFELAGDRKSVV